jgi:hypothetical protein
MMWRLADAKCVDGTNSWKEWISDEGVGGWY